MFFNNLNLHIILWTLLLGVVFYDFISIKISFTYIDELIAGILFAYYLLITKCKCKKDISLCILIFLFYLIYSIEKNVNVTAAIWTDFFIQIKPFIAFYSTYNIGINLTDKYKLYIKNICIIITIALIPVGVLGIDCIVSFMGHPSRYATTLTILGFLYILCSEKTRKNTCIMFVIWAVGLLSMRSKIYGFYTISIFTFFFINKPLKYSFKTMITMIIGIVITVCAVWGKFSFYFINSVIEAENMYARPYLYLNSFYILNDYFPFGSGFGSYANYASSLYYSPIYYQYNMSDHPEIGNGYFISDTFFPTLSQFGYVGVCLFFLFWYKIYQKILLKYYLTKDIYNYKICILIIIFFFIESTVDSTFTHNRGMMMMMILAMFLVENDYKRVFN
ncbi:hypothetical protein EZS27_013259 [termite gut metagenome]|uniref:O-antigen ligase domain-containing protein n=1 Tax=termite gut metagenome TaxID=433724 RepID=A0A5J4S063_9ZZZZ